MIIDPDNREVDEPVVTLEMSLTQAEDVQASLADLLCWCRGFMAGRGADFHYEPIGLDETRALNKAMKSRIEKARTQ